MWEFGIGRLLKIIAPTMTIFATGAAVGVLAASTDRGARMLAGITAGAELTALLIMTVRGMFLFRRMEKDALKNE